MTADIPDILKKIVAHKTEEVASARAAASISELKSRISDLEDTPRGFERHLREAAMSDWTAIIAEVRKTQTWRATLAGNDQAIVDIALAGNDQREE